MKIAALFCITYIFPSYELLIHQEHNENFMGTIESVSRLTSQKHILQNREFLNLLFHLMSIQDRLVRENLS